MADVRPFQGLRYNHCQYDLSKLICPPYDVISPKQEGELLQSSPYNYIRIEFSKTQPEDDEQNNRYSRALNFLKQWLEKGIFQQDEKPAYYLHEHSFEYEGKKSKRYGLFARIRLEEWDRMIVRPHERTLAGPKRDRIRLVNTLEANTSPVFGLYHDPERYIAGILTQVTEWPASVEFNGEHQEQHRLWLIDDATTVSAIEKGFSQNPLYIADGHHRYESALAFRNESHAKNPDLPADAALNFVMMSLTDVADPGMLILPTHRLVKGIPPEAIKTITSKLGEYFNIEHFSLAGSNPWACLEPLLAEDSSRFFIYGLGDKGLISLTVKNREQVEYLMPDDHTETYRGMDVSVVDHVVLETILGMDAMDEERIAYDHDRSSTILRVDSGEFQLAFILKPVHPGIIQAISDAQDKMPRKSTYFYPKIPSGVVLYRLKD